MTTKVELFAVLAPGALPEQVSIVPEVTKLDWNFGTKEPSEMIDLIAKAESQLKTLDKWVEGARGVLKDKLTKPEEAGQETVLAGKLFEAHYVHSVRTAMDQEKVKTFLGADYPNYVKSTDVFTLKIVPVTQTPGVV